MIYICPEKDRAVQKPCEPCICGMDTLKVFKKPQNPDETLTQLVEASAHQPVRHGPVAHHTLIPCPFCGCLASMQCHRGVFGSSEGYRVECEGRCHAMTCYWHTLDEARDQWNMRVTATPNT